MVWRPDGRCAPGDGASADREPIRTLVDRDESNPAAVRDAGCHADWLSDCGALSWDRGLSRTNLRSLPGCDAHTHQISQLDPEPIDDGDSHRVARANAYSFIGADGDS